MGGLRLFLDTWVKDIWVQVEACIPRLEVGTDPSIYVLDACSLTPGAVSPCSLEDARSTGWYLGLVYTWLFNGGRANKFIILPT